MCASVATDKVALICRFIFVFSQAREGAPEGLGFPLFPPSFSSRFWTHARQKTSLTFCLTFFFFGAGAREGTAIIRRCVSDWLTWESWMLHVISCMCHIIIWMCHGLLGGFGLKFGEVESAVEKCSRGSWSVRTQIRRASEGRGCRVLEHI